MSVIAFIVGMSLVTAIGWFFLNLLQGKTNILQKTEQLALSCLLGSSLSMFIVFAGHVFAGIPLTLPGFAGLLVGTLVIVGTLSFFLKNERMPAEVVPSHPWSKAATITLLAAVAWVSLRLLVFAFLPLVTPPFFDDTTDNWNLRGKLFFYDHAITLSTPWNPETRGVGSYPPAVPLIKTWLATLHGEWDEGLVNSVHTLWFIALLGLLYCTLRRRMSWQWALGATTALASLPVEMIQGTNAYADIFLSAHYFAFVAMAVLALASTKTETTRSALRVAAMALALMIFVKNEGWALYFPAGLAVSALTLLHFRAQKRFSNTQLMMWAGIGALCVLAVAAPWIGFKLANGLTFGNAKSIDTNFAWQPNVLQAILVNTFFEGNWNILFAIFIGALVLEWRKLVTSPFSVLVLAFILPYGAQTFAFLFTGLSAEALFQTGTARGLIHLMPVIVTLTAMLLWEKRKNVSA